MIFTERLCAYPLKYEDLSLLLTSNKLFVKKYSLNKKGFEFDKNTQVVIKDSILPKIEDESVDLQFNTMWIIVEKELKNIIGSFCFYGKPKEDGGIELGYCISPFFQNNGFMTEMLKGIIQWAQSQNQIKYIRAYTNDTNIASDKILERNDFELIAHIKDLNIWELIFQDEQSNLNISRVSA